MRIHPSILVFAITAGLGACSRESSVPKNIPQPEPTGKMEVLTIIIKPAISPLDRGDLFEEPIEEKLRKEGIGHWVGGGTLVDGSASDVAFKVNDVQKGLAVIRQVLRAKTPPRGIKVTIREENGKEHELEQ